MEKMVKQARGWGIRALSLMIACTMLLGGAPITRAAEDIDLPYDDISDYWGQEAVVYVTEQGYMQGSNGSFRPNAPITFAEIWTIIARIIHLPIYEKELYSELDYTKWYAGVQNAMRYNARLYQPFFLTPEEHATREEAALSFGIGLRLDPYFGNIDRNAYKMYGDYNLINKNYCDYINSIAAAGLMKGDQNGNFLPNELITRGEIAQILYNMFDIVVTESGTYEFPEGSRVLVEADNVVIENSNLNFLACFNLTSVIDFRTSKIDVLSFYGSEYTYTDQLNRDITKAFKFNNEPFDDFPGGVGYSYLPYRIDTVEQFLKAVNNEEYKDKYFTLGADLVFTQDMLPIKIFQINLDGNGHTITYEYHHSGNGLAGFIEVITFDGVIKNLNIEGTLSVSGEAEFYNYSLGFPDYGTTLLAGGLCAANHGEISNCNSNVQIDVNLDVIDSSGDNISLSIGGIAGLMIEYNYIFGEGYNAARTDNTRYSGKILNSNSSGNIQCNVNTTANLYSFIGGIVGTTQCLVSESFSDVTITATGGAYLDAGGIFGNSISGYVMNCIAQPNISLYDAAYGTRGGSIGGTVKNETIITECAGFGTITSDAPNVVWFETIGGIVGILNGDGSIIRDCYSCQTSSTAKESNAAVGGIAGRMDGNSTIENCYSMSTYPNFSNRQQALVGGIMNGSNYLVHNCAMLNGASPHLLLDDGVSTLDCTLQEAQTQSLYESIGWDFESIWTMSMQENYPYPILQNISTERQLAAIS